MTQTIKQYLLLLLFLFALLPVSTAANLAQRPDKPAPTRRDSPRPDEPRKGQFIEELKQHIIREAHLTPQEAGQFFPVFFEMREKQRNIDRQKNKTLEQAAKKNMNERDCKRVLDEVNKLNKKAQRIEEEYMQRLTKLIGAKKLVKALQADREFGRDVFKKMRGRKKN